MSDKDRLPERDVLDCLLRGVVRCVRSLPSALRGSFQPLAPSLKVALVGVPDTKRPSYLEVRQLPSPLVCPSCVQFEALEFRELRTPLSPPLRCRGHERALELALQGD